MSIGMNPDKPGVVIRPPLLYAGALVLVIVLRLFWPLKIFVTWAGWWFGPFLIGIGIALAIWGRRNMQAKGTNIDPTRPVTVVVTSGPFRFSRNPLYMALTFLYVGLTLCLNTGWGFVLLVPLAIVMHYGVVRREERYLENKFGETYRQYHFKVRRYL